LGSRLPAVHGVRQREGDVMNLIAGQLQDLSPLLGQRSTTSRDFHWVAAPSNLKQRSPVLPLEQAVQPLQMLCGSPS
jgi:hypothetical protein